MEEDINILFNLIDILNTGMCKFQGNINLDDCGYQEAIENLLKERQQDKDRIKEVEKYADWHKKHLTEDIEDYIDDDKIANANIIRELKEEREHWKDIYRILNNEKTYIDYKNY